jgi:heat shock protein HspQ
MTDPDISELPERRLVLKSKGMAEENSVKFTIGQIVHHKMFDYRGVIVDVDPVFNSTEQWYEKVALSRPPKDKPWYYVLVDGATHQTYVSERNLEPDESSKPIDHPLVTEFFKGFRDGGYVMKNRAN